MDGNIQVGVIMLGVQDVDRAKKFYVDGLGCAAEQDYPGFVRCRLGEGSSSPALYEWEAAARDAGVSPEGSGFRGVSFHFITGAREQVDGVMNRAAAAGTVVKEAAATGWGGYYGHFADPDGYLWKVTTAG